MSALCEHGADVGLVDGKGRTPLHLCCSLLHPVDGQGRKVGSRMVKILLGHGYVIMTMVSMGGGCCLKGVH